MTKTIGEKIKELRTSLGYSQEEVANVLKINRVTLSQIENNERKVSAEEKTQFALLFEIDQNDFDAPVKTPAVKKFDVTDMYYKFKNLVLYILNKCGQKPNVWEIVLNKLLYFSDFNYYELTFESISGHTYIKFPKGPVPEDMPKILDEMCEQQLIQKFDARYFGFNQKRYLPHREPDMSIFNGVQIKVIDEVIDAYSDKNGKWLTDFSHEDMPYKATQKLGEPIEYGLVFYRSPVYSVSQDDETEND